MKARETLFSILVPAILALAVNFNVSTKSSRLREASQKMFTNGASGSHKDSPNYVYTHATRSRDIKVSPPRMALAPASLTTSDVNSRMKAAMGMSSSSSERLRMEEAQYSIVASLSSNDVSRMCLEGNASVMPHPDSCAWYINCSMTPDAIMMTYFDGYVMECPYPQLFSPLTLQCEDFKNVRCQSRVEPKSPCEYRANRCRESSHCIPCWVRYSSCRGQSEGLNPWQGMEWQPFFVECHKERTVFQGQCHANAVFSPITRACETPMSIPSEYGGWKPGCLGRLDGLYPDEFGRCDLYFLCQGQLFRGFHNCKNGLKFNPFTSSCDSVENVPFPCGDKAEDKVICMSKKDGNYLDVFGRCNHYFTCKNETMSGLHVCTNGLFNVFTGQCDTSKRARSYIARPCGETENECLNQKDGLHEEQRTDRRVECHKSVLCERGLVIGASFTCRAKKTNSTQELPQ